MVERFIIVLYDRVSTHENVNEARREMFCKKVEILMLYKLECGQRDAYAIQML